MVANLAWNKWWHLLTFFYFPKPSISLSAYFITICSSEILNLFDLCFHKNHLFYSERLTAPSRDLISENKPSNKRRIAIRFKLFYVGTTRESVRYRYINRNPNWTKLCPRTKSIFSPFNYFCAVTLDSIFKKLQLSEILWLRVFSLEVKQSLLI